METKTKLGFVVLRIVDIPENYLLPEVRKELNGRELYTDCDDELSETIYSGDVFEAIAGEQAEMEGSLCGCLSEEAIKQVDALAEDFGEYELIRLTQV